MFELKKRELWQSNSTLYGPNSVTVPLKDVFERCSVAQPILTQSFFFLSFLIFFLPGILEWPFWTKLVVVAIGFTGGLLFMYVQCKVYVQLWKRLKAYNRVIYVQNCPETSKKNIFEKPALMEPNFESKEMLGVHHSDTNSSHYTEPEDCAAEILHV